jgi:hypothetical protein
MPDRHPAGLDPAHVLAICARATGGRRGLVVRRSDGIVVCLLPSRRAARRAITALARVGYEVTSVSAGRGRDLLVTEWNPAALESRLAMMRTIVHQLAGDPLVTARSVIERFRSLPAEARTPERTWELLNQGRAGLSNWVTTRSGIHALRDCTVQPTGVGIALRLRAAGMLEQAIDDHAERQLRVAGCALVLFGRLSGQMDDDRAQDTALRWAGIAFHLGGQAAHDSSPLAPRGVPLAPRGVPLVPRGVLPAQGGVAADRAPARTSAPGIRSVAPAAGAQGRPGPARPTAAEFPRAALASGPPANVVRLDPDRRTPRPSPAPRLRP